VSTKQPSIYDKPEWYDTLHSPGSDREVGGLVRIARAKVERLAGLPLERTRWLEPACGTGRFMLPLAKRGAHVVGVDLSRAMVDYAAKKLARSAPRAGVRVGDIERFTPRGMGVEPRSIDAAFCLHNSVRHLPTLAALTRHLARVRAFLAPDGVYMVGTDLLGGAEAFAGEGVFTARRGKTTVREYVQYFPEKRGSGGRRVVERVVSSFTVRDASGEREFHAGYDLQVLTPATWAKAVRQAGLEEIAVVSSQGRAFPAERTLYAVRVLRPRAGRSSRSRA
jgi:SAM-dependent methyltransferase